MEDHLPMAKSRLDILIFSFAALLVPTLLQAQNTVQRFDTAEIVLHSAAVYDGVNGNNPNPFDLTVTAYVTAPDGRRFTVDGFFDGDGKGGSVGNVFKARVYADQVGTWRFTTTSAVGGLGGAQGSIACSGVLPGVFGQGPIVENPSHPQTFMRQAGGPVYLLGKFLDSGAPKPLQWSLVTLSERLTDADRQNMLDRHLGMKANKMNLFLANVGDYGGIYPVTPWVGKATANDKTRFDLARWHTYESFILKLRASGMLAELWFLADDSHFGSLSEADYQRFVRYAMARTSGYVNTMYILILEWQEAWTQDVVNAHGSYVQSLNTWARLVSVHGWPGKFAFPASPWVDYLDVQSGNYIDYATTHAAALKSRGLAVKPMIEEEFSIGPENTLERQKAWAAFTAGVAGSGTGSYLAPLSTFISTVPFQNLSPNDGLVRSGGAYALAELGKTYVLYLYNGGTVAVDLTAAAGKLTAQWFNPQTGTFQAAFPVVGGGVVSLSAPAAGDWALYVHR
jgi:hypothetical protein